MVCGCGAQWDCIGNVVYIFEKVAAYLALTGVVSCIFITIIASIGLGVGIGYHYCNVEVKTAEAERIYMGLEEKERATGSIDTTKSLAEVRRLAEMASTERYNSAMVNRIRPAFSRRQKEDEVRRFNPVMIVPILPQINMTSLLSKIFERNENVTVEFIRI